MKKNYVKGQGQQQRPSINGLGSAQTSQLWSHASPHTPGYCVRAICQKPELLLTLAGHIGALQPEELAHAVAAATTSQHSDGDELIKHLNLYCSVRQSYFIDNIIYIP